MSDVTPILESLQRGDAEAGQKLLEIVYRELRKIAAYKMSGESAGHTLQPTALVHEAWVRLLGSHQAGWQNRGHFLGAAAEAMRRILVEHARRKLTLKRNAGWQREEFDESELMLASPPDQLLAVDDALEKLALQDPQTAELVKLRYFVGLTMEESATALGLSKRTAEGIWTYARVWLKRELEKAN